MRDLFKTGVFIIFQILRFAYIIGLMLTYYIYKCIAKIFTLQIIPFNTLKPKLVQIIFNNSVRTALKTQHFTITKINWLTLFRKIIAVYSENHTKPLNTMCGQNAELLIVKAGGTYGYL
jgi:CRISPR/Cas system-associated protein Csm6